MDLDILIRVCFALFIVAFAGHIFTTWKRIKAIKATHALELKVKYDDGYSKGYRTGWESAHIVNKISLNVRHGKAKLKEPELGELVQHCNSRTDYTFIIHAYNPHSCEHCLDIRHVVLRSN